MNELHDEAGFLLTRAWLKSEQEKRKQTNRKRAEDDEQQFLEKRPEEKHTDKAIDSPRR